MLDIIFLTIYPVFKMATKRDFLKMIRLFCSECMGGPRATKGQWPIQNVKDVADCVAPECIWFSYRLGFDPDKNPKRVAQGRKLAERMNLP